MSAEPREVAIEAVALRPLKIRGAERGATVLLDDFETATVVDAILDTWAAAGYTICVLDVQRGYVPAPSREVRAEQ